VKANLSQKLIAKLIKELGTRDLTVFDTEQKGLILRLRVSGAHSYRVQLARGKFLTLGETDRLTPEAAREMASAKLGEYSKFKLGLGPDPIAERRRKRAATFTEFLDKQYEPWAVANLKHHGTLLARIRAQFEPLFGAKPLTEITPWTVESWRAARLKGDDAVSKATANRDLAALKAVLSRAVQWGALADHPLRRVRLAKEDRAAHVRFLSAAEEQQLRAALTARDQARRAARANANDWRRQRGYPLLPDFGAYVDHLEPIVLVALNTGCRRGELFNLQWRDVDFVTRMITVRGEGAKSGRTRHVPMSDEARTVLKRWQDSAVSDRLFPSDEDGGRMTTLKTAWSTLVEDAKIGHFRFHDLRHTFASKLVQAGVDLASVRALLGHSDFTLTLRYAHLAPENLSAAVARLNGTR
jgi:integrase